MIARRFETRSSNEPPVRFYRTIAISFLFLTIVLLGLVVFMISKKVELTILAKEDQKQVNVLINVGGDGVEGYVTSTLFEMSDKFYPTGTKSIDDIAMGEVVLYNKMDYDQPLVKTTRLLSADGELFRLKERVIVPAGGEINAEVYADEVGGAGDIGPAQFTIPGLSSQRQAFVYAESKMNMSGGIKKIGVLSMSDLEAAKLTYTQRVKQSFLDKYGFEEGEVALEILSQDVESDVQVGDEVSEFNLSGTSQIVAVYYDFEDLKKVVDEEVLNKVDEDLEKVLLVEGDTSVSLVSYDLSDSIAQLSVVQDVLVTLDANAEKLSVNNIAGKSKDELERYILGLDHVVSVDVKFSPYWMRTAPGVSERVKILVKNVE